MTTRQAVILVGGKGTRLGAHTAATPKPLLPIDADTVFLDEVLVQFARFGFDDVVLLAGHFAEQFVSRYDGRTLRGARLRVVIEPEPAGTGGALRHAASLLAPRFLFANGDTMFDFNPRRLDLLLDAAPEVVAALGLRRVPDAGRYGTVELEGNRVAAFREKVAGPAASGLINGGTAILRRDVLDLIDRVPCSIETDVYPRLAATGRLVGAPFDGYFIDIGLPETLARARDELPRRRDRPALFLDRDGVLNHDAGYTHRVEDLRWIDGAIEVVRRANDVGALVIVVTNQAGVARGFYDLDDVARFHDAMNRDLARHGAHVDDFRVCPYHADATVSAWAHPDHPDRKPNPGMLLAAMADWPIDRAASVLIGDRDADVEAARRAGIEGILFRVGDLRALAAAPLDRMATVVANRLAPGR